MRVRGEEHRALGDSLPNDVKAGAVRLNVASREQGGKSIITRESVRELGAEGVRDVLTKSKGNPKAALALVVQKTAERVAGRTIEHVKDPERHDRER